MHGLSNNYQYTPDVTEYGIIKTDFNGKPKMKRTEAYNTWINNFKVKAKDNLPELNVDFDKPVRMWLFFEHKGKNDVTNFAKSAIDQICSYYGVDDKNVELMGCRPHGEPVQTYEQDRIWYCIKNI